MKLYQDAQHNFTLTEQAEELDEVVVRNQENENVESEMLGKSSLSLLETKNIPLVLGELNILKAATILPGISSAGEAATGFNVRGGKADQNLMLLNEAIIVNPNHFFGIFQALNPLPSTDSMSTRGIFLYSMKAEHHQSLSCLPNLPIKKNFKRKSL